MRARTRTTFSAIVLASLVSIVWPAAAQSGSLRIYFLDVDQGDATLIVTPNGRSLLVDAGDDGKTDSIQAALQHAGLDAIDFFLVSHYHADHYGGIDDLAAAGIPITDTVYDRNSERWLPASRTSSDDYTEYVGVARDRRQYLRPGYEIPIGDGVIIECVMANGRVKGEYGSIDYPDDENGYSIGLVLNYRGFDLFLGGDMHAAQEEKLTRSGVLKDVDVYQANHHGSHTSTSQALMDALQPEVVVISNGTNRLYKHPRKVTIDRLQALAWNPDIYQTNKFVDEASFSDVVKNVADEFIADLASDGPEGTILLEVVGDAYRVTLMDRGVVRTYPIDWP